MIYYIYIKMWWNPEKQKEKLEKPKNSLSMSIQEKEFLKSKQQLWAKDIDNELYKDLLSANMKLSNDPKIKAILKLENFGKYPSLQKAMQWRFAKIDKEFAGDNSKIQFYQNICLAKAMLCVALRNMGHWKLAEEIDFSKENAVNFQSKSWQDLEKQIFSASFIKCLHKFQQLTKTNNDRSDVDCIMWSKTIQQILSYANYDTGVQNQIGENYKNKNYDNQQDKEKTIEIWSYTLSKKDFDEYFKWDDFRQQSVGDCWLLSFMDWLTGLSNYEKLIRQSVIIDKKWNDIAFNIRLPLWCPDWKVYDINIDDYSPQITIDGDITELVSTSIIWIHALLHAFGQKLTWQRKFDFYDLDSWHSSEAIHKLIYWMKSYSNNWLWITKLTLDISWYKKDLNNLLNLFDPKKHILSVSVLQWYWYSDISKIWYFNQSNHSINVERVNKDKDWNIKSIKLSNPYDASHFYDLKYPECLEYLNSYYLWSFYDIWWFKEDWFLNRLVSDVDRNQWNRWYEIKDSANSLNWIIMDTWQTNKDQMISRWDVIVKKRNWCYYIDSRWKNDTYITFDNSNNNNNPTINIWNKKISFSEGIFSDSFMNDKNSSYKYCLYPPRLSVFINKMRNNYIDNKKYSKETKTPFGLSKNWNLLLTDDADSHEWTDYIKRKASSILWDKTINILEDWSLLWIDKNDDETKWKIINFLNSLI